MVKKTKQKFTLTHFFAAAPEPTTLQRQIYET